MLSGDFETGAQALERSIDIDPSATAYSNLGLATYYLGDYEQAAAIMLKAVEIAPKDHIAWANLTGIAKPTPRADVGAGGGSLNSGVSTMVAATTDFATTRAPDVCADSGRFDAEHASGSFR